VDKIVDNVKKSLLILAVDGCDTDCSRRVLEQAGIKEFIHLRVIDLGMVKGETPVTEERIQQVAAKARDLLGVDALSL